MSRPCTNCGAEVSEGAPFCDNCGTPTSEAGRPPRDTPTREGSSASIPPREVSPPEAPDLRRESLRRLPASPPPASPPRAAEQPPASAPPRRGLLVLGLLVAVMAVGIGAAVWFLSAYSGDEGEALEVPSLEGRTLEEARRIVGEDFELVGGGEPRDVVRNQDPGPGERAARGSEISVTLGGTVPDVVGLPRDEAEEVLRSRGFEVEVATREGSAGEVLEQTPRGGGEAGEGSRVAITVGEDPQALEYVSVADGALSTEVPSGWETSTGPDSEAAGPGWTSFLGANVGASITAAPDLAAWHTTLTPGAYVVASRALAQGYTNEELVVLGPADLSGTCTRGVARDFERPPYLLRLQAWRDCGGDPDAYFFTVAAAPEDRECVVVMQLGGPGKVEQDISQHIIDAFEVDCGALAA